MQLSEVYVMSAGSEPSVQQKSKLLDKVRAAIRSRHYSRRTEQCYRHWTCRDVRHRDVGRGCAYLRLKDVDFGWNQTVARNRKGQQD
jgi:hypothetical protein